MSIHSIHFLKTFQVALIPSTYYTFQATLGSPICSVSKLSLALASLRLLAGLSPLPPCKASLQGCLRTWQLAFPRASDLRE